MTKKTGGRAFPLTGGSGVVLQSGMTMRQYYAGQALAGLMGSDEVMGEMMKNPDAKRLVAILAWQMADMMLLIEDPQPSEIKVVEINGP